MSRARWRTLAGAAALGLVGASCVPASEALPPAGAFGFVTAPSPASRGEPFLTADGWTVRIEKVALRVRVSANPQNQNLEGRYSYGGSEAYLFDAAQVVEVFARAVPAGPATGNINLAGSYISGDREEEGDERAEVFGLSPEEAARFRRPADADVSYGSYSSYNGPSVLLGVRAEKDDRVVRFDLSLAVYSSYQEGQTALEVRANALVTTPMSIVAESLFVDDQRGDLRFDPFANADADQDGMVSGAELSAGAFRNVASRGRSIFVPL